MKKCKGIIFDFDGVICDTVPLHFQAWRKLFTGDYSLKFEDEDYKKKVDGRPRLEGIKEMMPNLTKKESISASDRKQKYFLDLVNQGKAKAFTGTLEILNQLQTNYPNIKLAVASSSKNVGYLLKKLNLDPFFKIIVSGNDINKGKPDPEIFLLAASKMNLNPSECIVVEDAIVGVEAAIRGDFQCIGVDRHNEKEYFTNASLIVNDLSELSLEDLCYHL